MRLFLLNLFLALVWAALTENFSVANVLAGFVLGYLALRLGAAPGRAARYARKVPLALRFALFYAWEVVRANLRVARQVLLPVDRLKPAVIAIPLRARTDAEITVLANLTTFSPGSISVYVSADRRVLYVHVMNVEDPEAVRREIRDLLEGRILQLWR